MVAISAITALSVGVINTATALIAYQSFIPKRPVAENEPLISTEVEQASAPDYIPESGAPAENSNANSSPSRNNSPRQVTRKPGNAIAVGQAPQPASATTTPEGQTVYRWCSGSNPALEDAVCEAVISIAANPSVTNPHLGEKAKKSLSMLPKDSTLTMDESSWKSSSSTSGTMLVTLHTQSYGDVRVKMMLEKLNGIWVVNDGQLA